MRYDINKTVRRCTVCGVTLFNSDYAHCRHCYNLSPLGMWWVRNKWFTINMVAIVLVCSFVVWTVCQMVQNSR